jgi:hypothetical protein
MISHTVATGYREIRTASVAVPILDSDKRSSRNRSFTMR